MESKISDQFTRSERNLELDLIIVIVENILPKFNHTFLITNMIGKFKFYFVPSY